MSLFYVHPSNLVHIVPATHPSWVYAYEVFQDSETGCSWADSVGRVLAYGTVITTDRSRPALLVSLEANGYDPTWIVMSSTTLHLHDEKPVKGKTAVERNLIPAVSVYNPISFEEFDMYSCLDFTECPVLLKLPDNTFDSPS